MFIQPPSFKHDAGQTLPAIVSPLAPQFGQQDGVCVLFGSDKLL